MSKIMDLSAICQMIGCIYNNPSLLSKEDKYNFIEEDFVDNFHKICFCSMYNLYQLGAKKISIEAIYDYLEQRPKKLAEFKAFKGDEYILKCAENAKEELFDYYYQRIKKMSLLRAYNDELNFSVDFIYDADNILDVKKKQEQEDWLDSHTLQEIVDRINDKIDSVKSKYVDNIDDTGEQAGEGIDELLEELKQTPDLGYPYYTKFMNNLTRGQRFGKFYLRSAATGVGKTRSMIADACYIACSQMYDIEKNSWISIGSCQPVLFIATEQDFKEIKTMCISFISGVDEQHILIGEYYTGEWERVTKAAAILKQSKLFLEFAPDFSMNLIENLIKKHIRENNTNYVFFDYIHTSTSMLTEIGQKSGIKNLREDNLLFLLSTRLKDLAVIHDIFIMSSTQLNGTWQESDTPDQNLLRGSKAIADRIDAGMIMLDSTSEDKEKLKSFLVSNNLEMPNVKISFYKVRQGQYKGVYLWVNANKGNCRFNGSFVTKWDYTPIDMKEIKIKLEQESAF